MNKRFVTVGLALLSSLLSFAVAGNAAAGPRREPRMQPRQPFQEERERPQQSENKNEGNHAQPAPAQSQQQQNQGRSGFGEVGQSGNLNPNQFQQPTRMGARMSVEDRRKLRRQINEAGQDIYQGQKK